MVHIRPRNQPKQAMIGQVSLFHIDINGRSTSTRDKYKNIASQGNPNPSHSAFAKEEGPTVVEGNQSLTAAAPKPLPTVKKGKILPYSLEI